MRRLTEESIQWFLWLCVFFLVSGAGLQHAYDRYEAESRMIEVAAEEGWL